MTSKTTTKTARNNSVEKSRKACRKKSSRINRQRRLQEQLQILLLERHSRKCIICHHPEREAIEEEFLHWRAPWRLAEDYKLADYRTIYRHARAAGILLKRRENLHSALDAYVEAVDEMKVTPDSILRAMRAYSCIDSHGRWTEIPTQVQISTFHDASPTQPSVHRASSVIDIDPDDELEEDEDNVLEERVASLSTSSKSMSHSDTAAPAPSTSSKSTSRSDATAPTSPVSSKPKSHSNATACAVSPAQALPRDVIRGQNPNDRSPSDRTDCAASLAQPAAPQKPKPDSDGFIWHPRPGYPDQEISEPDAQGRVAYKIHITPPASQLPSRETDARRAADLIYRSVIKKYGNP
jgi:hypothetical protein